MKSEIIPKIGKEILINTKDLKLKRSMHAWSHTKTIKLKDNIFAEIWKTEALSVELLNVSNKVDNGHTADICHKHCIALVKTKW